MSCCARYTIKRRKKFTHMSTNHKFCIIMPQYQKPYTIYSVKSIFKCLNLMCKRNFHFYEIKISTYVHKIQIQSHKVSQKRSFKVVVTLKTIWFSFQTKVYIYTFIWLYIETYYVLYICIMFFHLYKKIYILCTPMLRRRHT